MKLVKIEESTYMRDLETNAIINTNRRELESFNQKRKKILEEKREQEETKIRLTRMENDVNEIKKLLENLIHLRSSNGN